MQYVRYATILLCLIMFGCSENDQTKDQMYQLTISTVGKDRSSKIVRQIGLVTEGDHIVSVARGDDSHTQECISKGGSTEEFTGTVQITLTVELKDENETPVLETHTQLKTISGQTGGLSSKALESQQELSRLISFQVDSGTYDYGEEVLLGTVEGEQWILIVK